MALRFVIAFALAIAAAHAEPLTFEISEGLNLNSFIREGNVSAHVVVRSGHDPRLLVAFPAGNSGIGVWFSHQSSDARWTLTHSPAPLILHDGKGRMLHGVRFDVSIDVPALDVKQVILSSIRVLRDYQSAGIIARPVMTDPVTSERDLIWQRDRLDGAPGYFLRIEVKNGSVRNGHIEGNKKLELSVTAASGDRPLEPLDDLLNERASPNPAARQALAFLSYKDKFLAGSWRFDTYFGRDTLLTLMMLMPVLRPDAVGDGLRSVLQRLSPNGDVAHEEDISEYAILDHLRSDGSKSDAPVFDYKMIDETMLLAPVAAAWLLDDPTGRRVAASFMAGPVGDTGSAGSQLMANFRRVLRLARPFANDPQAQNLIGLKTGQKVGDWRDSEDGLGGGHYPYDVNAVLVPAALQSIDRLNASGLIAPYLKAEDRTLLAEAGPMAKTWQAKAPHLFEVAVSRTDAEGQLTDYARDIGISPASALLSLPTGPLRFDALALDSNRAPIPVLNSDASFALLFTDPDPIVLDRMVSALMRPFPAGLMTDAGLLVSNPAFADTSKRSLFGRNAYHGTVVWSWQQAMLAKGLSRQLSRSDLPSAVRANLKSAEIALWRVIKQNRAFANSELWSWSYVDGQFRAVPFGARHTDTDESDAVQLWSTVYLAIPEPGP